MTLPSLHADPEAEGKGGGGGEGEDCLNLRTKETVFSGLRVGGSFSETVRECLSPDPRASSLDLDYEIDSLGSENTMHILFPPPSSLSLKGPYRGLPKSHITVDRRPGPLLRV